MFVFSRWMSLALALTLPAVSLAAPARERAVEQIPELMGRILESQEEIRERESEMTPVVERYDSQLAGAKQRIEFAIELFVAVVQSLKNLVEAARESVEGSRNVCIRCALWHSFPGAGGQHVGGYRAVGLKG